MIGTLCDDNEFRNRGERERSTIAGAIHIPLAQLGAPRRGAHRQPDRGALRQRLALKRGRIVAAGTGIRQRFGSRRRLPAVGPRTDGHLKSCPGSTTIPPKTSAHLARDDPTRGGPGGRRKPNPHTAYLTLLRFSCRGRNPACKPPPQSASRGPECRRLRRRGWCPRCSMSGGRAVGR